MGLIIGLLVIWLILTLLGVFIKGLVWLVWIGVILFVVTAAVGFIRNRGSIRS